jgi:hypothetical protein
MFPSGDWNMGWKGYVYGHSNGRLPDDSWNGILTNGLAPLPFMDSIAILWFGTLWCTSLLSTQTWWKSSNVCRLPGFEQEKKTIQLIAC